MKYFRLMSSDELRKFMNGEVLDRQNQKSWFLETSNFYFISEDEGGLKALQEIAQTFINEDKEELFIIGFESDLVLTKHFENDYEMFESICPTYSSKNFKIFGYIRSGKNFDYDEWVYDPFIIGMPFLATPRSREIYRNVSLSKSIGDKNYSPNKTALKKAVKNRRKDRLVKYSIR